MATLPTGTPPARQPRRHTLGFGFDAATRQLWRTPGGRPFALRVWFWTAMATAVALLLALPLIAPGYGEILSLTGEVNSATLEGRAPDPELAAALNAALLRAAPGYALLAIGPWLAAVAGEGALHRKLFRGEEHPRIPLRFGADEWRILATQLAVYGLMLLAYVVFILLAAVSAVGGMLLVGLAVIVGVPVLLWMLVWIPLRHCTAGALAVGDRAFRLAESRAVTKHRSGPLLGTYLFVWVVGNIAVYAVLTIVVLLVSGDAGMVAAGSGLGGADVEGRVADFAARLRNPVFMLLAVLGAVAYAAVTALWFLTLSGVGAYALRWYEADVPERVFD